MKLARAFSERALYSSHNLHAARFLLISLWCQVAKPKRAFVTDSYAISSTTFTVIKPELLSRPRLYDWLGRCHSAPHWKIVTAIRLTGWSQKRHTLKSLDSRIYHHPALKVFYSRIALAWFASQGTICHALEALFNASENPRSAFLHPSYPAYLWIPSRSYSVLRICGY